MTEVVSVRFRSKGKVYYFSPNGLTIKKGEHVIVETAVGLEFAECVQANHSIDDTAVVQPLRPVIRIATPEDMKTAEDNRKKEAAAFDICKEKIAKHGLEMKLVDVEYNFECNKILFFFTSDGRVDFRELVKDLASVFKTRIELRQIGVRDEARMMGGISICGRPFCCAQFLDDFQPVSIKMAKTQGLSLNPTKISGTCGRLMCCLKYEQDAYEELVKHTPKVDAFVQTPQGKGSVADVNILRGYVRVRMEDQTDTSLKSFPVSEIQVLGGKAARAEYLAAKAEGLIVDEPPPAPEKQLFDTFPNQSSEAEYKKQQSRSKSDSRQHRDKGRRPDEAPSDRSRKENKPRKERPAFDDKAESSGKSHRPDNRKPSSQKSEHHKKESHASDIKERAHASDKQNDSVNASENAKSKRSRPKHRPDKKPSEQYIENNRRRAEAAMEKQKSKAQESAPNEAKHSSEHEAPAGGAEKKKRPFYKKYRGKPKGSGNNKNAE